MELLEGKIVAVETYISDNGKFRVLIAPDEAERSLAKTNQYGLSAQTLALLEDVPVWFEIWRTLNGFPPNYYQPKNTSTKDKK